MITKIIKDLRWQLKFFLYLNCLKHIGYAILNIRCLNFNKNRTLNCEDPLCFRSLPLYSTSTTASLKVKDMMFAILKLSNITWKLKYMNMLGSRIFLKLFPQRSESSTYPICKWHVPSLSPCQGPLPSIICFIYRILLCLQ
jgi:hypothetical protein